MRVALFWLSVLTIAAGCMSPPQASRAQDLNFPGFNLAPPTPLPPPPPQVYIPEIPVLGQVQQPRNVKPIPRAKPSFGDRATRCLDYAAAQGLSPNQRNAYVGACANQQ